MDERCPKALWYSIHHPELRETLPPWTEVKFAFGTIIESLALALVKASGHTVEGEQDVIELDGVLGHRDCVVDGCTLDVKSCTSRGLIKFKSKDFSKDDLFGYLDQLDGYVVGSRNDHLVKVKDKGYILAIDKTLGHVVLYEHVTRETSIRNRIAEHKRILSLPTPPDCLCKTVPEGLSGNLRLDTKASYSQYKHICFPHLRTFIYANGPKYLTKVVREPDVREINNYSNFSQARERGDQLSGSTEERMVFSPEDAIGWASELLTKAQPELQGH